MTTIRIALAAALAIGTASAAFAEDGQRMKSKRHSAAATSMQSKQLNQSPDMNKPGANLMLNVMDRASSPFACGG